MKTVYASFPDVQSIHESHLLKIAQQKRDNYSHDLILRIQKLSYPSQKHNESLSAFSLTQSKADNKELVSNWNKRFGKCVIKTTSLQMLFSGSKIKFC